MLTPGQYSAVHASVDHPIAIVACPGSGKTFTIIHRIAHLLQQGFHPQDLLVITFSRKAAEELRSRLLSLSVEISRMTIKTFHAFGLSVLHAYGSLIGINSFKILKESDQFGIIQSTPGYSSPLKKKDVLLQLQRFRTSGLCSEDLRPAFNYYLSTLKKEGLLDFTDLIIRPLEIFQSFPDVLHFYQNKYKYCLVDELQDVSKPQFDLIKTMFSSSGCVTVVGDDDQAIYGWRGADPELLGSFSQSFARAEIIQLSICFRCPQFIVKAMSRVIQNNEHRVTKKIESGVTAQSNMKIIVYELADQKKEAEFVAGEVKKAASSSNSVAVLFRTRKAAIELRKELKNKQVSLASFEKAKFLESRDALMITNLLKFVAGSEYDSKVIDSRMIQSLESATGGLAPTILKLGTNSERVKKIAALLGISSNESKRLADEADESNDLQDFIDDLSLTKESTVGCGVQLSTIHQAKGLEWDNVFIIGATKKGFHTSNGSQIEEERRLFYVAMSRARKSLVISYDRVGFPCPFLSEIPENLVKLRIPKDEKPQLTLVAHPTGFAPASSLPGAKCLGLTPSQA